MTSTFQQIEDQLAGLIDGTQLPANAISELDRLLATVGGDLPADLRHYLQRRSYSKALEFCRSQKGAR